MHIEIDKNFVESHVLPKMSVDSYVVQKTQQYSMFGATKITIDVAKLTLEELDALYNIAKEQTNRSLMSQIAAVRSIVKDPNKAKISSLKSLVPGLIEYFKRDAIDGWVYRIDDQGIPLPYLVQNIKYVEADGRYVDRAHVVMQLVANTPRHQMNRDPRIEKVVFDADDIQGKTIPELLAKERLYHETPELRSTYDEHLALFQKYQPQFNTQFWVTGRGYESFEHRYNKVNLFRAKAVNDEEIVSRRFVEKADPTFWREHGVNEKFEEVPFHSYVYMFHLDLHKNMWVHVTNMVPYEYDPSLRDKLILPEDHRDLIDILVQDMDILMDDIVKGKSGGTTILCVGGPGLGKTLSAEVYAEVVQRPLYRVHSGQLGLEADKVEKNLNDILKRAARWGAVLLIDEADVYIRRRENDIVHNAVVAAFLRTLEYFNGLLFMTTNRGDDVDDAILSRCIAVIKYELPTPENARRIWRVLADQFEVELDDQLIEQLVEKFPNASGRDIKELLKLTSKYAKGKNIPLSVDAFRKCAQFRGL